MNVDVVLDQIQMPDSVQIQLLLRPQMRRIFFWPHQPEISARNCEIAANLLAVFGGNLFQRPVQHIDYFARRAFEREQTIDNGAGDVAA